MYMKFRQIESIVLEIRTMLTFGKEGGVAIEKGHEEDFSIADNVLFLYLGSGYRDMFTL